MRPRIGLVLGSGAARGWAHVGVLDALIEAGIVPELVCGTSIGALVGAAHAGGHLDALRTWALAADWRAVASMVDVNLLSGGLVEGERIVDWLATIGITGTIEDLPLKFAAVATDLATGREVWLQEGPVDRAIRASISMPGIFSPVRLGDRWLVDGGLVNPVPVSLCRALGADFIIAVRLNDDLLGRRLGRGHGAETVPPAAANAPTNLIELIKTVPAALGAQASQVRLFGAEGTAPGYFDVLANSIDIMQDQITRSRLAGEPPHVQILPRLGGMGLLDFHRAEIAIREGRAATEAVLPVIKARLESAAE